jgi:hypothetical protein
MEKYKLEKEVRIICVKAKSFPDCIKEAFETLEKTLPEASSRTYYGISQMEQGCGIVYKAGATENFEGEAGRYGFESFLLPKAEYLAITINNWRRKEQLIGETFGKLLADPRMDTNFPCVEWYKDDDVTCMVKIDLLKEKNETFITTEHEI